MWELFVQAGPLVNVYLPKDRVTSQHQGYGFVEFKSEEDADYVRRQCLLLYWKQPPHWTSMSCSLSSKVMCLAEDAQVQYEGAKSGQERAASVFWVPACRPSRS